MKKPIVLAVLVLTLVLVSVASAGAEAPPLVPQCKWRSGLGLWDRPQLGTVSLAGPQLFCIYLPPPRHPNASGALDLGSGTAPD